MSRRGRRASLLGSGLLALALLVAGAPPLAGEGTGSAAPAAAGELRGPDDFAGIENVRARSAALFVEVSKVLLHPRCVNCHPSGDRPLAREHGEIHEPPVERGSSGLGAVGMRCGTCHHDENFDPGRVPGAPHWRLAPIEMAWQGLSAAEICVQLKDPERNGDRSLEGVAEHMANDDLVGWGWSPGADRDPAPGSQQIAADLIAAWVETGAVCPEAPGGD